VYLLLGFVSIVTILANTTNNAASMVIALDKGAFLQQNSMSTWISKKRHGKRMEKRQDLATMTNADLQYSVILAPFNNGGGQRKISHSKRFVQFAIQNSHG
jgi:hypothetical protein